MSSNFTLTTPKLIKLEQPTIGLLIRALRLKAQLTQDELAIALGVNTSTISRWENGHSKPMPIALRQVQKLIDELGEEGKNLVSEYLSTNVQYPDPR